MTEGPYPNHLAFFMAQRGLTDPALAKKTEISKQQIFNLRHGHRKLTVEWAKRLAPHLDIPWERLITGPPSPDEQLRADWMATFDDLDDDQRRALIFVGRGMARHGGSAGIELATPPPKPNGTDMRPFPEAARGDRLKAKQGSGNRPDHLRLVHVAPAFPEMEA